MQQLQGCRSGATAARMSKTHHSHERSFQNMPSDSSLRPHEWCPEGDKAARVRGKWIEGTNNESKIEAEHRVSRGKKHMLKKDEARNSKQVDIMLGGTRPARGT